MKDKPENPQYKWCPTCWGDGAIDINDDTETIKCDRCNGKGVVKIK